MSREKEIITDEKYNSMCKKLGDILINENFDYIFGVQRGGLPIAVYLSHYLNVDMNNDIDFCSYGKKES